MDWDYRKIRKRSWNTAFKKGFKSWWLLVCIIFIFAFIGASDTSQATIIDAADQIVGLDNPAMVKNVEILQEYVAGSSIVEKIPFVTSEFAVTIIESLSKDATWIIQLFGANMAYFQRNQGEIIFFMSVAAIITMCVRFFIQNTALIGRHRYVMENRFHKKMKIRRIFAPYHLKNLPNIIWVSFRYNITLMLWYFTIIGGIYKTYQYSMIPYILAENPNVKWREARKLSTIMTKGYKWKMFCTQLSYIYIWILKPVPIAGICITVPLEVQLNADFYFFLREKMLYSDHSGYFIERVFDEAPYVERKDGFEINEDSYLLKNLVSDKAADKTGKREYLLTDFIMMFFIFCFIGWLWEVGLYIVRDHQLVNRGVMYGPWLPIYGSGGAAIIFLLNRFKEKWSKLFVLTIVLCGALEYMSSLLLDFIYNVSYWDYKDMFLNLNGRICFAGLLAFGLGGMFGVYVGAPKIKMYMSILSRKKQIALCLILTGLFAADLICCALFGFNSGSGVGGEI